MNATIPKNFECYIFFIKKRYTTGRIILILTNIIVVVFSTFFVLLAMKNILLQSYQLLVYKLYIDI